MIEKKSAVYKGKGYILIAANKELLDSTKKKKKYIYIDKKKKNIFNKFKSVILPLLSQNYKKKSDDNVKNDINLLNENEINSFLLRNKAFRLTWSSIIDKIKEEIDIEISKNLNSLFEEIYLYSISNNEHLPLILVSAGTNVSDHEIIIDTLSYELKKWNYKKRKTSNHSGIGISPLLDDGKKKKKKKRTRFNEDDNEYDNDVLINKLNKKKKNNGGCGDNDDDDGDDDNDIYVCSLNSSTSNSINSAIYHIYDQLYKEFKTRNILTKYKKRFSKEKFSKDVRISPRRTNSNSTNFISNGSRNLSSSSFSSYIQKELIEDCNLNIKVVSIDKLIELYKTISEVNRKEEEDSENFNKNNTSEINDPNFDNYNNYELYNKQNNYFSDGRKKVRIIILIHDCEYFNINVLNGILNVLINLRIDNKICLSVILGVSTPSFFFNRITSPDTQSKLRIKTVDILNNKLICENICNSLLFENILPFIINFRTMHAIRLLLHKNNQSISHLIHILYMLTKEFYDNSMFSFLSLPINCYLNVDDYEDSTTREVITDYSPYTYVRSYQKSFSNYVKYDIRKLHKKIICLCYSANLFFRHFSYIKKKYSSILVGDYFNFHGKDSVIHTPTTSDNECESFTLKKNYEKTNFKNESFAHKRDSVTYQAELSKQKKNPEKCLKHQTKEISSISKYGRNVNLLNLNPNEPLFEKNATMSNANPIGYKSEPILNSNEKRISDEENNKKSDAEDLLTHRNAQNAEFEETQNIHKKLKLENHIPNRGEVKNKSFDRNAYAWQFKANTINWWYDHPFKDIVYSYENLKIKNHLKNEMNKLLDMDNNNNMNNLHDVNNIKEINKNLCEFALPISILQLIERKYAFNIAINLINTIIKCKPEYNNSMKRIEYFRKSFENYEKIKWHENKNILFIEEIYKVAESDVKKCINLLIDIITPYCFKSQEVLLKLLKEFKRYYIEVYAIVYNLEDYLYLLKEKEKEKDMQLFTNDDFAKAYSSYSVSFSIYYSLLYKLEDLIEMLRKYINKANGSVLPQSNLCGGSISGNSTSPTKKLTNGYDKFKELSEYEIKTINDDESEYINGLNNENLTKKKHISIAKGHNKNKAYKRYLTIENSSLKKKPNEDSQMSIGEISDSLNIFIHDYLFLLLLPPVSHHPLSYELIIHKPDKDFTDIMTMDIKSELLITLCYTNPYKTGNLMCSCCFNSEKPVSSDLSTNIVCNNKIYLNPYCDNIQTLEDLVNICRLYEKCNKTIDLYNLFILFLNIKVDNFLGYSVEDENEKFNFTNNDNDNLCTDILQEYYLKFIVAISTFCYFFKILKPPNVSALLNYDDKEDYSPNQYDYKSLESHKQSITTFLSDIKKSLQGCTSKKLLFGKFYYNQTIMSRELCLQRMMQHNSEHNQETPCYSDSKKRKKK